ncbi:MAG TPA: DUF4382 domain-containing protein [Candidatus Thermoplasmatota archaeon]|nr:DUF4382 domain-containing protein [Candidatus Thermoplasmatota archaeon]
MVAPRLAFSLACMFLVGALAGCAADGDSTASAYVKDSVSTSFREVHLVITGVSIHQSGGGNETSGWKDLFNGPGTDVNLMNASGSKAFFLGRTDLAAGKYQQMRIQASSAYGIDMAGAHVAISLPDKDLKVVKGFKLEAGKETQLVLDIDLEKSLKQDKSGAWEFKPVIGKLYAGIKEKGDKPSGGELKDVDLKDDATE